jgi:hypothetical protein
MKYQLNKQTILGKCLSKNKMIFLKNENFNTLNTTASYS